MERVTALLSPVQLGTPGTRTTPGARAEREQHRVSFDSCSTDPRWSPKGNPARSVGWFAQRSDSPMYLVTRGTVARLAASNDSPGLTTLS